MNKRIFGFAVAIFLLTSLLTCPVVKAAKPLDHIHDYEVTVDMRKDGSCDISYHIVWEVLDSESEGPLTWIEVGIANKYADEYKAISDNIDSIRYYSDGGDYVRLDLDKRYKAGETLVLDFSLHQKNLFTMEKDCANYKFTPGWFPDTPVDKVVVRWNAEDVLSVRGNPKLENGYYVWVNDAGGYNLKETVKLSYVIRNRLGSTILC